MLNQKSFQAFIAGQASEHVTKGVIRVWFLQGGETFANSAHLHLTSDLPCENKTQRDEGMLRWKLAWDGLRWAKNKSKRGKAQERAYRQHISKEKNMCTSSIASASLRNLQQDNQSYWITDKRYLNNCRRQDREFPIRSTKALISRGMCSNVMDPD